MEDYKDEAVAALLSWYDRGARVLPWRSQPTPYRVWVSEIMLQQTQVATVLPYFERFMSELPDVAALAEAREDVLLKLWEGLGYYSRVRNLKRAAEQVMAHFQGQLPASKAELLTLAGIGEYTAGAIASIAFGKREAAVDGNALRVFARFWNDENNISEAKGKKHFQLAIEQWVPFERPGDFNQSIMELGARICLPKAAPICGDCPWQRWCKAYRLGKTVDLPVRTAGKERQVQKRTVLLLISHGQVLLCKRPSKGLLAGMWEFISLEGWLTEAELGAWLAAQGFMVEKIQPASSARHIFTHKEWQMQGWAVFVSQIVDYPKGVWVTQRQLEEAYAMPSAYRVYLAQLPIFLAQAELLTTSGRL